MSFPSHRSRDGIQELQLLGSRLYGAPVEEFSGPLVIQRGGKVGVSKTAGVIESVRGDR